MANGARPGETHMLSPYPPLDAISTQQTHSASLTSAQAQIKELQEENFALKKEIAGIGSAYKQLITENTHESFDERRVNFLKAQLIQLERQLVVLSEALSSRSSTLYEVENSLAAIADMCRAYLHKDGKMGEVLILRSDLQKMAETAESSRIRLYKNIENTSTEKLERPLAMFDKFLRPSSINPPTLLDVCSGKLDHLNIKHVAKLESRLSLLYKQLILIDKSLQSVLQSQEQIQLNNPENLTEVPSENKQIKSANQDLPRCVYMRLSCHVMRACNMLKDATQELLMLGVLLPSAPWPVLKKPLLKEVTVQAVMSKMTGLSKAKATAMSQVIDSLIKAMNYSCHMANTESRALKEELAFHQEIYQQQSEYMEDLFHALRGGYSEFEASTNKLLCEPLTEILRIYDTLKVTATEDALKKFLQVFRDHADQLSDAVLKISHHLDGKTGEEAISSHGAAFFSSLKTLKRKRQQERDKFLGEYDLVKQQQVTYMAELQKMFPEPSMQMEAAEDRAEDTANNSAHLISSENYDQQGTTDHQEHVKSLNRQEILKRENKKKHTPRKTEPLQSNAVGEFKSTAYVNSKYPSQTGDSSDMSSQCNCGAESLEHVHHTNRKSDPLIEQHLNISTHRELHISKNHHIGDNVDLMEARNSKKKNIPKPVKGIPQSNLVLQPMKRHSLSPVQTDQHRLPMDSDGRHSRSHIQDLEYENDCIPDSSTSNDFKPPTPTQFMKRSGSLSRLGDRTLNTGHLEPLMGAVTHRHFNSSQNIAKPWK